MYRKVEESQTLLINNQSKLMAAQNKKIIKFGFGQSPFLPPDFVIDALRDAVEHKEYSSVQGDLELRELMADFHFKHNGLKVKPDNILLAPGSKILIYSTLLSFEKADVFIPSPAWVSYAPQAKLAGHNIIKIETTFEKRWRISAADINNAISQKQHDVSILILNYPGNPDGLIYSENELIDIAKAVRQNDILVISDEIYGLLNYDRAHLSFANYYPEKTITITGLSKWCGAGGWRFGAAFLYDNIDPEFKQALIGIGSETYSCAPTPVQIAAKAAYQDFDKITDYLSYQTNILSKIGNYCADQLNARNVNVHAPQGGFYIFPGFTLFKDKLKAIGISTSNQLCERLLAETSVALLPGSAFGFDQEHLVARLAFVDFREPINADDFDINSDCPNIIEGIGNMCKWFTCL
jgi:aspartate aminotransferase